MANNKGFDDEAYAKYRESFGFTDDMSGKEKYGIYDQYMKMQTAYNQAAQQGQQQSAMSAPSNPRVNEFEAAYAAQNPALAEQIAQNGVPMGSFVGTDGQLHSYMDESADKFVPPPVQLDQNGMPVGTLSHTTEGVNKWTGTPYQETTYYPNNNETVTYRANMSKDEKDAYYAIMLGGHLDANGNWIDYTQEELEALKKKANDSRTGGIDAVAGMGQDTLDDTRR